MMDSNDSMSVVSEDTANSLQDNLQNLNMIEAKDDCDDAMMTSDDDYQQMSLDTLPAELLLHILQYLEVRYITTVLSRVCRYFCNIANDEATWKIRIQKRWPGPFPSCQPGEGFSWTRACIGMEEEAHCWGGDVMTCVSVPNSHYGAVDAVHVMDDVVVSGSRDRAINVWNIDQVRGGGQAPIYKMADAHKGWVWSFCSEDRLLVSGAWDNTVKFWQVGQDRISPARPDVKLKVAVLATSIYQNRVAVGCFDKRVIQMDTREEVKRMTVYKSHSMPVLAVKVTEKHILSLSEDGKLVVFDRKAGRKYKTVAMPGPSFPMCMSLYDNSLYVGDKSGGLHLVDIGQDKFDLVQSYKTGHSGRVTSIDNNVGSVLTGSSDGSIKVFHSGRNLVPLTTVQKTDDDSGEVAQISYRNHVLAAAYSNNAVKIWTPSSSAMV